MSVDEHLLTAKLPVIQRVLLGVDATQPVSASALVASSAGDLTRAPLRPEPCEPSQGQLRCLLGRTSTPRALGQAVAERELLLVMEFVATNWSPLP